MYLSELFRGGVVFVGDEPYPPYNIGQIISETDKNEPLYHGGRDKNDQIRYNKNNNTREKASQRTITNAKGVDKIFYKGSSPNKPHIQPLNGKRSSHHQYIFKFKSPDFPLHSNRMHFSARNSKINQTRGAVTSSRTCTKNAFIINIPLISSPAGTTFQNFVPFNNRNLVYRPLRCLFIKGTSRC